MYTVTYSFTYNMHLFSKNQGVCLKWGNTGNGGPNPGRSQTVRFHFELRGQSAVPAKSAESPCNLRKRDWQFSSVSSIHGGPVSAGAELPSSALKPDRHHVLHLDG